MCLCPPCIVCLANAGFVFELISSMCANVASFSRSVFIWTEIQYFIVFVVIVYTPVGLPVGWLGKQEVDGNVICGYWMQRWKEKPHIQTHSDTHIHRYTHTSWHKLFCENVQQLVAYEQVVLRIINGCTCGKPPLAVAISWKTKIHLLRLIDWLSCWILVVYIFI